LGFHLHKFESMSTYHNNDSCQKLYIVPVDCSIEQEFKGW